MNDKYGPEATEWLRQRLAYDSETGVVTWIDGQRAGLPAGNRMRDYWRLQAHPSKHTYLLHRVAWMLHYGEWPDGILDHIDCDRSNNRIANLRIVTSAENSQNVRRAWSNSSSGLLGAHKRGNRWCSRIGVDGRTIDLGTFDTPQAAHAAYMDAKKKYHVEQPEVAHRADRLDARPMKLDGCSSKFRGVNWESADRVWRVTVRANRKKISGGRFADEVEAARAYDALASALHGERARLNFPALHQPAKGGAL